MAKGLFSEAEVIRGHDWIWGNQDGKGSLHHRPLPDVGKGDIFTWWSLFERRKGIFKSVW